MLKQIVTVLLGLTIGNMAWAESEYRDLISKVRKTSTFYADVPIAGGITVKYGLELDEALYSSPHLADFFLFPGSQLFFRTFTDKILLKDGAFIQIGDVTVPATCLYIHGQDNRFSGKESPLIPDFIFRFTIVANDFSCTGPINPNWPEFSVRKETWDTFVYYEVRDPTIMLPSEIKLRYRWNEYQMIKKEN